MIQEKAQFAVDVCKNWNAVLGHLWVSLRARREAVICCVAPHGKDQQFPARRALQLKAARHAESTINCAAVHSLILK
jgi:sigma54-dependent transcription regulator